MQLRLSAKWKMQMHFGDSDDRPAGRLLCYIKLQNTGFAPLPVGNKQPSAPIVQWIKSARYKWKKKTISLLKLKSLHGIKLNHRLCHIICVTEHKKTHFNIRDNWCCLKTMNEKWNCTAATVMSVPWWSPSWIWEWTDGNIWLIQTDILCNQWTSEWKQNNNPLISPFILLILKLLLWCSPPNRVWQVHQLVLIHFQCSQFLQRAWRKRERELERCM